MKKTVYYLGNPLLPIDNKPFKLIPFLAKKYPDISFIHYDPTEELPLNHPKNLILIDTIKGITKAEKFEDPEKWILSPRVTVHDYDLPLELRILRKLGKIKKVIIIGVPAKGINKEILKQVEGILGARPLCRISI